MMRRLAALLGAAAAFLFMAAAPAAATFTENTIGCAGSAIITKPGAGSVTVNADDAEVKVPRKGSAAWKGAIATTTHNHSGEVRLKLAVFDIALGDWGPSKNAANENSRSGTKQIPSAVEQLPAGKYVVSGFHQGDEGRCAGEVVVEIEGGIFSSPVGIVSTVGTFVMGGLMFLSAMAKGVVR